MDEETITRAAIANLTLLKKSIKEISEILDISRALAWKWAHFENFEAKGKRKKNLMKKKGNFCVKRLKVKLLE